MGEHLTALSDRDAYNAEHGTNLQEHDDSLTPEQAGQINAQFDIVIYAGAHGRVPRPGDPMYGEGAGMLAEQYDEAAKVVDGLRPGDTLFTEYYGFDVPELEPFPVTQAAPEAAAALPDDDPMAAVLAQLNEHVAAMQDGIEQQKAAYREELERRRLNGTISAWRYAEGLAILKGMPVVRADADAVEKRALDAQRAALDQAVETRDASGQTLTEREDSRRDEAARNIVKDKALERLRVGDARPQDGRKPQLAILTGLTHGNRMRQTFDDIDLHAELRTMDVSQSMQHITELMTRSTAEIRPLF